MKKLLLPFFLIGTIAMMFVMAKTGAPLKTPSTAFGILNLEFAYNTVQTSTVINTWYEPSHPHKVLVAIYNTFWDFLFLFFYTGFLFLACKKISENLKGRANKAGEFIARCAILAGISDVLENIGMLLSLHGHIYSVISFLTVFFSIIKWGLALIAVLYVIAGSMQMAYLKIRNKQNSQE